MSPFDVVSGLFTNRGRQPNARGPTLGDSATTTIMKCDNAYNGIRIQHIIRK